MGLERNLGFQILREVIQCDLSNYFNTSLSIRWLRKNLMTRGGGRVKVCIGEEFSSPPPASVHQRSARAARQMQSAFSGWELSIVIQDLDAASFCSSVVIYF